MSPPMVWISSMVGVVVVLRVAIGLGIRISIYKPLFDTGNALFSYGQVIYEIWAQFFYLENRLEELIFL